MEVAALVGVARGVGAFDLVSVLLQAVVRTAVVGFAVDIISIYSLNWRLAAPNGIPGSAIGGRHISPDEELFLTISIHRPTDGLSHGSPQQVWYIRYTP